VVLGRAMCKKSQEYSFELCKAILMGCRRQLIDDGRLMVGVVGIQRAEESLSDTQLITIANLHCDEDVELMAATEEMFADSLTGQPLDPEMMHAARRK
jgi:hypothetical protein